MRMAYAIGERNMTDQTTNTQIDIDAVYNMTDEQIKEAISNLDKAETVPEDSLPSTSKVDSEKVDEINKEVEAKEADGILAADGKTILPIGVIHNLRVERNAEKEARITAEKKAADNEARAIAAEERLNSFNGSNIELDESLFTSDEELEVLEEDMPGSAAKTRKLQELAKSQAAQIKKQQESYETQQRQMVQAAVESAIDAVPKLAIIKALNPELYAKAELLDNTLRTADTNYQALSLKNKFENLIERIELMEGGAIGNDGTVITGQSAPQGAKNTSTTTATPKAPTTLSDMPGGSSGLIQSDKAESMTEAQIVNAMQKMTPQQQADYMASLY